MVHAEKKAVLGEIHQERDQIVAAPLDFDVLAVGNVIDTDVRQRSARHPARHFLAHEEIRMAAQRLAAFNRVVVRQSDEVHAALFEHSVDVLGIAVAFPANRPEKARRLARAREVRVNVEVAFHEIFVTYARYVSVKAARTSCKRASYDFFDTRLWIVTEL